jgi:hypothetical protein
MKIKTAEELLILSDAYLGAGGWHRTIHAISV